MTPWEQLEAASNTAAAVHGAPQHGFDPVPGSGDVAPFWFTFRKQPFAVVHAGSENVVR